MGLEIAIKGSCYCKSVSYTLTAAPITRAYCHCTLCQRLTGCPFVHTIHFKASAFSWTHPKPHESRLDHYSVASKPHKTRYRCNNCGATVASYHAIRNLWSVWGAHLERNSDGKIEDWELVKPTAHIFYDTRMLDINDGLGKWDGYENISNKIL